MTIYTDRITLVFPIAAKNRQAAASLQTLKITDAGKEFETLVPGIFDANEVTAIMQDASKEEAYRVPE